MLRGGHLAVPLLSEIPHSCHPLIKVQQSRVTRSQVRRELAITRLHSNARLRQSSADATEVTTGVIGAADSDSRLITSDDIQIRKWDSPPDRRLTSLIVYVGSVLHMRHQRICSSTGALGTL